jgi:hypothetical protein
MDEEDIVLDTPQLAVSFIVIGSVDRLLDALKTLYEKTRTPFRVYVVVDTEGGANDPQIDRLREYSDIQFIFTQQRQGFAANHNLVMRHSNEPFIALLNDDILLQNDALDILVSYLEQHPQVGLVGAQLYNPDGSRQVSAYSDPSLFRVVYKISGVASLTHQDSLLRKVLLSGGLGWLIGIESLQVRTHPQSVEVIKGVAMVTRREVLEQTGLMDEITRAYGEEYDWHFRIRQAGWEVVLVPQARLIHLGKGQVQLKLRGMLLIEDRKAILHYFQKHRPAWQVFVVRMAMMIFHGFFGLVWLPFSREKSNTHWQIARIGFHGRWAV